MPDGLIASLYGCIYTDGNAITENTNHIRARESPPSSGGWWGQELPVSRPGCELRRVRPRLQGSAFLFCFGSHHAPWLMAGPPTSMWWYDEQRKMNWIEQTAEWVWHAPRDTAGSETERPAGQTAPGRAGAFISKWEQWEGKIAGRCWTMLVILMAATLQYFCHKEKNILSGYVSVQGSVTPGCIPGFLYSVGRAGAKGMVALPYWEGPQATLGHYGAYSTEEHRKWGPPCALSSREWS